MLETLLTILAWDTPAPSILLEEDGDIELEWWNSNATAHGTVNASIDANGKVNWAVLYGPHGTDINELKRVLCG
jgi:hypothetical protein